MTLKQLKRVIEEELDIADISKKNSARHLVRARALFWFYAVKRFSYSVNESAIFLGFTHAAALTQLDKHENRLDDDRAYESSYEALQERLSQERVNPKSLVPDRIFRKLSLLSNDELVEFEHTRINPYLKLKNIL